MNFSSENDRNFHSFYDIRLKMAPKLCARVSQDKSLTQLYNYMITI